MLWYSLRFFLRESASRLLIRSTCRKCFRYISSLIFSETKLLVSWKVIQYFIIALILQLLCITLPFFSLGRQSWLCMRELIPYTIMQHYKSEKSLPALKSQLVLPKIAQAPVSLNKIKQTEFVPTLKSKRSLLLLKEIKPAHDILSSDSSSDTSLIARKIATPEKKSTPTLAVLSLNKNKKERISNKFLKEVLVGEEAVQKFYDRYKHIEKYKQKEEFYNERNPVTEIVQVLQAHGFAPRKLDVIKLKGSHAILDLRKLGLGHGNMGSVVTSLMELMGNFEYVDLSSNQIDRLLSESLVPSLGKIKIVNLSSNRIGKVACEMFANLFQQPGTKIQELYLSDNNLMDNAGAALIQSLGDYNYLRVLNLSKNFMGNRFAAELKEYLSRDDSLEELYLGWNQFGDKAAKLIFEAIGSHSELKVLDYSWNLIGVFSTNALASVLKENESLVHVDISFCEIDKKNSKVIAAALENNHTIYGFHYEGNSGAVDRKGYLRLSDKQHHEYPLPIVKGMIRTIDSVRPNPVFNEYKNPHLRDVCWICHSWQQMYFKVPKETPQPKEMYVHISSEGYNAIKMQEADGYYETYRMLAIEPVQFFFTANFGPGQRSHFVSSSYPVIQYSKVLQFKIGQVGVKTEVREMNRQNIEFSQDPVDENYFASVHCIPRSQEVRTQFKQTKKVVVKKKKKVMREEKLKMKFRELDETGAEDFLKDKNDRDGDYDYLRRCIEFDVANSKLAKILKNEEDLKGFKEVALRYYRDFKDTFYFLANSYPNFAGLYSIAQVPFEKFLMEQKYVTKRVTHAKIMLKMISCLSANDESTSPVKNPSPDKKAAQMKLFLRPQFLQFLTRLALEKWCTAPPKPSKKKPEEVKQKKEEDQDESPQKEKIKLPLPLLQGIQKTLKTLPRYSLRVRASNWRQQKYLVIDNYTVIKGYEAFLLDLFQVTTMNRKRLDKPKKLKGLMTLEQLKGIFVDCDIKRTKEAAKDVEVPFLDSKRLEVEEGIIQFGLNFDEFCECLARYSEILWFAPVAAQGNEIWESEMSRRAVPLFIKFEALIVNVYRKKLDMHNRKMDRVTKKGLFEAEMQILLEKIKEMDWGGRTDLSFKMNSLQPDEEITLKGLISGLRNKYENMVVHKEEEVEWEEEHEVIDEN